MEACEMLDVIHFFFEEDFRFVSEEDAITRDELRKSLYKDLYASTYEYALKRRSDNEFASSDLESLAPEESNMEIETINPFNPRAREVKPYVEATPINDEEFNPFGSLLDDPLT